MIVQKTAPPTLPAVAPVQEAAAELEPFEYHRYHIATQPAPDVAPHPSRFLVEVKKHRLAWLLLTEVLHYRGDLAIALSRPCMYGVFSGPVGGFAPREQMCVGCLRCTTQYPDVVQILPNPERLELGDSYFTPGYVDTVCYEAQTGRVPVRGAGYRGRFGGPGWDGLWTDMSEIVRPTRDGIHGREFISTAVDIGERPAFLQFDEFGRPCVERLNAFSISLPIAFDAPPAGLAASQPLLTILSETARATDTLAILPARSIRELGLAGPHLVPLVAAGEEQILHALGFRPRMIELAAWDEALSRDAGAHFADSVLALRVPYAPGFEERLLSGLQAGLRVFHLVADYHGCGAGGRFALDLIRRAHAVFVEAGCRDEVTLLGSGGIVAAEHVAKAILCGLDAVAIDTPALVALQGRLLGECADPRTARIELPALEVAWGVQRLENLLASWHDQLLEVMGAMGLREVRRMRGEFGRAMLQHDLEREAFGGIEGYDDPRGE